MTCPEDFFTQCVLISFVRYDYFDNIVWHDAVRVYAAQSANAGVARQIHELYGRALLFLFGISIGGNKELVSKLHSFGAVALAVAVATVCGSVIGGWLLWKFRSKV